MDNDIPTWRDVPPAGRLLRPSEVVRQTGLSRSQLYAMIAEGRFPPFLKLSERASAMPESWLDAFIAKRAAEAISRSMRFQDGEAGNV